VERGWFLMVDTNVETFYGVSSLSRMGGLIVDGYYFDKPACEGRVPLLLSLHGNHFTWRVGHGPIYWGYNGSSWVEGVMELLESRMKDLVFQMGSYFLRCLALYCCKLLEGGEVFFFYDQWRGLDFSEIVRGMLEWYHGGDDNDPKSLWSYTWC
jgi:hypothetical protein